jgi:hypothetical protein
VLTDGPSSTSEENQGGMRMRTRVAICTGLLLALAASPVLAQEDPATTTSAEPVAEETAATWADDLWVFRDSSLLRIDAQTGEVVEWRALDGVQCPLPASKYTFAQPQGDAVWYKGPASSDAATVECYGRVMLDNSSVDAFWIRPRPKRALKSGYFSSWAPYGENLAVVAADVKAGQDWYGGDQLNLYEVEPGGDVARLIQKRVSSIAPTPIGPVVTYTVGNKRNPKIRTGILQNGEIKRPDAFKDLDITGTMGLGPRGLVAETPGFLAAGKIRVLEPATGSVLGRVMPPGKPQWVGLSVPTPAGAWIAASPKKGGQYIRFVPFDSSAKSVDACAGRGKTCVGWTSAWADDTVLVQTVLTNKKGSRLKDGSDVFRAYSVDDQRLLWEMTPDELLGGTGLEANPD